MGYILTNETIQNAFDRIQNYIKELETKVAANDQKLADSKKAADNLVKEKMSATEKLNKMEEEMMELSSVYEDLKGRADVEIDLQEVMKLYIILTEQVLDGNSHIRMLTLLHGKKDFMTKEELSKASGIQPAATLRTIFDLRNNGLVTYNDENHKVKLVRRLFD